MPNSASPSTIEPLLVELVAKGVLERYEHKRVAARRGRPVMRWVLHTSGGAVLSYGRAEILAWARGYRTGRWDYHRGVVAPARHDETNTIPTVL
jgi:hypothetical protein